MVGQKPPSIRYGPLLGPCFKEILILKKHLPVRSTRTTEIYKKVLTENTRLEYALAKK